MIEWALLYASIGWKVFPLTPAGKTPATAHGRKGATSDEEQGRAWWGARPDANVGMAGGGSGVGVLAGLQ